MDRLDKNKHIADACRETRQKRKSQIYKCFKFKISKSSLSKEQANQLKMQFVEVKWIYNYLLDKDIFNFDYKNLNSVIHKDRYGSDIETEIKYVGSSIKQEIIQHIKNQIKGLSVLKKHNHEIGRLKYKSEFNSIPLKQYGNTHVIKGKKIKVQGIKKPICVRGLDQLNKYETIDYANAKLIYDGIDYFISLTCFIPKEIKTEHNTILGIDMGVATTLTLSDGTKYDISVEESEKLKRLERKLSKQKKGSNNRYKTILKIRKEHRHITNKRNDIANKIVSNILSNNDIVVIQDEQIAKWHQNDTMGSKIQHSVLGRIKAKLIQSDKTIILDKWFPTTKYCSVCGTKLDLTLNDRIFKCPVCGTIEDRDIHAAKNMIYFYLQYNKLDRDGINHTSIKGPVKIAYNKFVSKLAKQEDTTSLAMY